MLVVAKSNYANHFHEEDGIKLQFDSTCILETKEPKKIALLEKYAGLNGRWVILKEILTKAEQKESDAIKDAAEKEAKDQAAELAATQAREEKELLDHQIKALGMGIKHPTTLNIDELKEKITAREAELAAEEEELQEKSEKLKNDKTTEEEEELALLKVKALEFKIPNAKNTGIIKLRKKVADAEAGLLS